MKTLFTLLLATIFGSAAFAYEGGKLTISIANNRNYQVYVDGRLYQDNDNTYTLNNLRPGNHTITIYRGNRNNSNQGRNNNRNNNRGDLVYSSTVLIRSSYHVDVMINRFGKAMVDERVIAGNGNWDDNDWNNGNDGYGNGGYGNGGYGNDNGDYNNGYNRPMSESSFNQLLQDIRNSWIGKLGKAKDAVQRNYFTTIQMRQMIQLFTAESDRLELAKLSYRKIVDRQNFRQLYDQFSYQGQSELDRYVREYRN
jgi:hypothetical protein